MIRREWKKDGQYISYHPPICPVYLLLSVKPTQWMFSYLSIQSHLHLVLCVLNHSFTHPLTYPRVCPFAYLSLDFNTTTYLSVHP